MAKPESIELTLLANPEGDSQAPGFAVDVPAAAAAAASRAPAPWWHPEERGWVPLAVLVLSCFLGTGGYFSYLSIGVIEAELERDLGVTATQFNWLYSAYSFPNFVLPFIGGFILDSVGIRFGLFLTLLCCFVGTLLVAIASHTHSYTLMLFGRILFGIGGDTVYVAQNTICCAWFKNRFLAVCMGLMVSAGRLGTALTFLLSPKVIDWFGSWRAALWLSVLVSGFSLCCGVAYNLIERWAEGVLKHKICREPANDVETLRCSDLYHTVRSFPREYWLMVLVAVVYYCVVFPFEGNGVSILVDSFQYTNDEAANAVAILPLTSALLSPVFGFFVDLLGHRLSITILGMVTTTAACLMLTVQFQPVLSIILLGMAFALVPSAIWPCMPLIIAPHIMGIAFGLISVFINVGLAGAYPLIGHLRDTTDALELVFFLVFAISGLVCAFIWQYCDRQRGSVCNGPGKFGACGQVSPQLPR